MDHIQTHPLQQQSSQQSSGQPHLDSTPQDVLAEARKNLQVLIDSGISKEILHQWVDGSPSLQLNFLAQSSFAPSSTPPQSQQSGFAPPPPQPQCLPPPPPTTTRSLSDPAISTMTTSPASSVHNTPSGSTVDIKSEGSLMDNHTTAQQWAAIPGAVPTTHDGSFMGVNEADNGVFVSPALPYSHRARISVSSTSSGSSGHASLWSVNSARSSMSWQSVSSARTQAPLPMPPPSSASQVTPSAAAAAAANSKTNIYWCTSCDTSFKRKYDWKRHEDEFHERWRKYPCPEPGCNRSFWGSNSFNQHHKQCHGCTTCPHAEKVVKFLRKRKYWACGFCSALHPARERHVEHVARHFESGLSKNDWMHSRVVYGLLHQPLIHTAWETLMNNKQAENGGRRPQFSWHPNKTGRAQGFLEKENPGQLQDLLEFFSGDEREAQWIVSVAYDLADVVMANSTGTSSPSYAQSTTSANSNTTGSMPPPPPAFPPTETHIAFAQLPSQQPPQPPTIIGSSTPNQQTPFASPPFRGNMYTTSQFSSGPRHSPDSASNSPLALSSPPQLPSQSPMDKRELPALPSQAQPGDVNSMMDFEYSPAPVMFSSWDNLSTEHLLPTQAQQHQQHQGTTSDWGMMQYFSDPRVAS